MRTVTVVGGDLYRLALLHLGDATQWNRIAQLNRPTAPAPVAFYDVAGANWDSGGSYDAHQVGNPLTWLDPVITGTVTLKMPSVNPSATGGVLVL